MFEVQYEVSTVCDDLGAMPSAGFGGGWSAVYNQVQSEFYHLPGYFKVLHPSFKLYGDPNFYSSMDFAAACVVKTTAK